MSTNLTSCEYKIKKITGGFKAGTLYRSILGLMHQGGNFKKTTHSWETGFFRKGDLHYFEGMQ